MWSLIFNLSTHQLAPCRQLLWQGWCVPRRMGFRMANASKGKAERKGCLHAVATKHAIKTNKLNKENTAEWSTLNDESTRCHRGMPVTALSYLTLTTTPLSWPPMVSPSYRENVAQPGDPTSPSPPWLGTSVLHIQDVFIYFLIKKFF